MANLERTLRKHYQYGVCSRRALAEELGVDSRTVRRWLAGEDHPPADMLPRIRQWIDDVRSLD